MAPKVSINDRVDYVGSQDWDRRLFDSLIPLPDGTSYNSYVVRGSNGTALIDTVDPRFCTEFAEKIKEYGNIDYVVINHVEQDHSGCLNMVLDMYPRATALCSEKAKDLILTHLHTSEERIRVVSDGEELDLGDRTLRFVYAPFVHWPETMLTFLAEDRILFSCDMFGSHKAGSSLFACGNLYCYVEPCKRYFAEIMMPFSGPIKKNLEKVASINPSVICPSHGPCWEEPSFVIDLYRGWVAGPMENRALILDVSMHGSTKAMVERLTDRLSGAGITVERVDITAPDLGKVAVALVDAHSVIIGTPTVLAGPHPAAALAALLANALRPRTKLLGVLGSYGWGGKAAETIASLLGNLSLAEVLPPLMIKGMPDEEGMSKVDQYADLIIERHRASFPEAFGVS